MRDKSKRFISVFYSITTLISFIDAAVYLSLRSIWFFINQALKGASGADLPWGSLFFLLFCASFLYSCILLVKSLKGGNAGISKQTASWGHPKRIHLVLPVILLLLFTAIDVFLYLQLGNGQNIVPTTLLAGLPWFLLIAATLFITIVYPDLKISHSKAFKYTVAGLSVLVTVLLLSNFGEVRITSGPVIQLLDDTKLSVVWTTNKNSTAYVEYGPDEENLRRVASSQYGIYNANTTVHKVILPVNETSEFIYRVGSTKINHYFQNSVEYGNTAVSSFKKYRDYRQKDRVNFYILNDIHENLNLYNKLLKDKEYDFIVLNGDMINSADSRKVIETKLLKPIGEQTEGTKPFYPVRGNHETRGANSRDLMNYMTLPQNNFFYTFKAGPIFAIVLDSAEDKPDSHEEYSGLADFEKYLEEETEWLKTLEQSDSYKDAKYKVAFVHIPLNDFDELEDTSYLKNVQRKWSELLNKMGIDAVFSGHSHSSQVIKPDYKRFNFPIFIGGGNSMEEKNFTAIRVEDTGDSMKVYYVNTAGDIVSEYEISGVR